MAQFNRSCNALGKTAFGWCGSGMRWALVVVLMALSQLVIGQNLGDYQFTKANASWENSANWQIWNGAWVAATEYPGQSAGTKKVTVSNGQRATISSAIPFPIESLELVGNGPNYNLNSNIARLVWLADNCPLTVTGDLLMSFGSLRATAALGGIINVNGNLIVEENSSIREVNATINGTTTINSGAFLNFDNIGPGDKIFRGQVTNNGSWGNTANYSIELQGGFINNGTFTSGTGTYSFTTFDQSIEGSQPITFNGAVFVGTGIALTNENTDKLTINGNLTPEDASSTFINASYFLYNGNNAPMYPISIEGVFIADAVNTTVEYGRGGNQIIQNPISGYRNLIITGSGVKSIGPDLVIKGDLTIQNSATFNPGTLLSIQGNWTNNHATDGFTESGTTVTFNGSSLQTITNTGGETFETLIINNSAGINLLNSVSSKFLEMQDGNITTNANELIVTTSDPDASLVHTFGKVIGKLKRNMALTGSYLFPLGTTSHYRPAEITVYAGAGGDLIGEFIDSDPGDPASPYTDGSVTVDALYTDGYWHFENSGFSSSSYDLSLDGKNFANVDFPNTRISSELFGEDWLGNGTHGSITGSVITRTGMTNLTGPSTNFALGGPCPLKDMSVSDPTVCAGGDATITLTGSQNNIVYQLRDNTNSPIGSPVIGDGNDIDFTFTPPATSIYNILATSGVCSVELSDKAMVTLDSQTANAGSDQTLCGVQTTVLAGNTPSAGTGTWSKVSGPGNVTFSLTDANTPGATATVDAYGTYVLRWTIVNGDCTRSDEVSIDFNEDPTGATAATAQNLCGTKTATLDGVAHSYEPGSEHTGSTTLWSKVSGPGTVNFTANTSATSDVSVSLYGTYVLRWTETNGTCTRDYDVTINFGEIPELILPFLRDSICNNETINIPISGTVAGSAFNWNIVYGNHLGASNGSGNLISQALINSSNRYDSVIFRIVPTGPAPTQCVGSSDTVIVFVEPTFRYTIAVEDTICNKNTITFDTNSPTNALGTLVFDLTTTPSGSDITGYQPSNPTLPLADFSNTLTNNNVNYQYVTYSFKPRIIYAGNSRICSNGKDTTITVYVNPTPQMTITLVEDSICFDKDKDAIFKIETPNKQVIGTMKYDLTVSYDAGDVSNVAANGRYDMVDLDQSTLINTGTQIEELTYTFTPLIENYRTGSDCGGGASKPEKLIIVPEIKYQIKKKEFIGGRNIRCFNETNGSAKVINLSGGASGYTYEWSNASVKDSAYNLSAQQYFVTVTDKIGCERIESTTLTQPDDLKTITDSIRHIKCDGGTDGAIYITPQGGTSSYTYKWVLGLFNSTNEDLTGLAAGPYRLTVTDANKCTYSSTYPINYPSSINWNPNKSVYGNYNVSCYGRDDGSFTTQTVSGTYLWTGPDGFVSTDLIINNLKPGAYQLQVTDLGGCIKIFKDTIREPALLVLNPSVPLYDNGFNVQCEGGDNGSILLNNVTGGHGNYQYTWLTADGFGIIPGASSQTLLTAGTYEVKVFDGFCRDSSKITLTQPPALNVLSSVPASNGYEISCNKGTNGSISLDVSGGFGSYSYQWATSNGKGLVSGAEDQSSLGAGLYNLTVTYGGVCNEPYSFTLREPNPLIMADSVKTSIKCYGDNNGGIWALAGGGVAPYTYQWTTTDGSGLVDGQQAQTALTAGTYTLFVTDKNLCQFSKAFSMTQPDSIQVELKTIPISCSEGSDGSIEATVTGGIPQYSYTWSNGATTSKLIKVPIGNYFITVTDKNACRSIRSVELTSPSPLLVTPDILSNYNGMPVSCFGASDGKVALNVGGGSAPYTFKWSTGATSEELNNLPAGNYKVTVSDNYGCLGMADITLNQPDKTAISWLLVDNLCYGEAKGKITVTAQGGVQPYNFLWSDNNTGANRTQLLSGSYTLHFSDANNCAINQIIAISQPEKIVVDKTLINAYCPDATDGEISVDARGGIWPYQYTWYDGTINPHLINVRPGIYTLSVTDGNNCLMRDTIDFQPKYPVCLDIPTAFSPNGDDKNPTWVIWAGDPNNQRELGAMYPNAVVEVFNRWGELLFRSQAGYPIPWDGKFKGRELPLDSYYYVIDTKTGARPVTGIVTIVK